MGRGEVGGLQMQLNFLLLREGIVALAKDAWLGGGGSLHVFRAAMRSSHLRSCRRGAGGGRRQRCLKRHTGTR